MIKELFGTPGLLITDILARRIKSDCVSQVRGCTMYFFNVPFLRKAFLLIGFFLSFFFLEAENRASSYTTAHLKILIHFLNDILIRAIQ